jgi:SAM-dependent methyltransferase
MKWWKNLFERRFFDAPVFWEPSWDRVKEQCDYFLKSSGLGFSPKGRLILDLGAGTGSHCAYLKEREFRVTGIEYSQVITDKGRDLYPGLDLEQGDMRDLIHIHAYDAITFFDTSFGLFDDETNLALLSSTCNALKEGGCLAIDYMNPGFWSKMTEEIKYSDYSVPGGTYVRQYEYDANSFRLRDRGRYLSPEGKEEIYPDQILALYTPEILEKMLKQVGFDEVHFYGTNEYSYPAELIPIGPKSAFIMAIAKKNKK